MADFIDVRAMVLSGEVKQLKEPIYLDRLGGWFNVVEPRGDLRAQILQAAISQKTGRTDVAVMYAALAVAMLTYPAPDCAPTEPVAPAPLQGSATEEEQAAYKQAMSAYRQALADFQHSYPTDHPKAGEPVFQWTDREAVSAALPGGVLEEIATPAMRLAALKKEDLDQEKKG